MTDDGFSDFRAQLEAHLDWFAERGLSVPVWWRDDDAVEPTPALDRLIAIANTHDIEVSLAVIPKEATEALAERIANEPFVAVLQHGYEHRNHQDKARGEKAAEFGSRRDADESIRQLAKGCERLTALFGPRFVPVFVPPWNRLSQIRARRTVTSRSVAPFRSATPYSVTTISRRWRGTETSPPSHTMLDFVSPPDVRVARTRITERPSSSSWAMECPASVA